MKEKIIRVTTVPQSLRSLLKGQLKFMNKHYKIIGVSGGGSILDEVKEHEGIEVYPLEMSRKISPISDLQALFKLYRLLKRERPFIIHTHTPKAGTLGMIAGKLAGVPNRLHTIAGLPLLEATGTKRKVLDLVEKITYACATKIYPNSYGLQDIILQNGYTKERKLKVIGKGSSNGINTGHFATKKVKPEELEDIRKQYKLTNEDFIFVFVGRIVKDKGINELVQAFKEVNIVYPHTKLILVGTYEKDLDPVFPETLEMIHNHPSIHVTGWQKDVRPFMAAANALVFPSYREGFPNVVMQACSMELPGIVSDINGCNEIINDGETGFIIPPKSTEALKESMEHVLTLDRKKIKEMGVAARQYVIERFEQNYIWEELLKEYKHLEAAN